MNGQALSPTLSLSIYARMTYRDNFGIDELLLHRGESQGIGI